MPIREVYMPRFPECRETCSSCAQGEIFVQEVLVSPSAPVAFFYSDEGLIAEKAQDITLNGNGSATASGQAALATQYGPKPESEFATGALFVKTKDSHNKDIIAYYHHNHLNTPIQATDKQGNIVWSANFNAFGRMTISTPATTPEHPITDTSGYLRVFPRTFLQPTVGGYMQIGAMSLGYGCWSNYFNPYQTPADCGCE
jgi:hypothetical protein